MDGFVSFVKLEISAIAATRPQLTDTKHRPPGVPSPWPRKQTRDQAGDLVPKNPTDGTAAFGFFRARVRDTKRMSPTFLRVMFDGESLRALGNPERTLDQRIKLIFPGPDGLPDLDEGSTFADWKSLPEDCHRSSSMVTATTRLV